MGNFLSFGAFVAALVCALGWYILFVSAMFRVAGGVEAPRREDRSLSRISASAGVLALLFVLWRVAFPIGQLGRVGAVLPFNVPESSPELHVINMDGTDLRRLTFTPGWERSPTWSPDGTKLAWDGEHASLDRRVWVGSHRGGNKRMIDPETNQKTPAWAPDTEALVCSRSRPGTWGAEFDLYYRPMDGGEGRWITDTSGSETAPAWSPDGTKIVFEREATSERGIPLDSELHVIDSDGTDERLILPASGWGLSPRWSPDATEIAYSEPEGIAVIPAEGGERRWLVRDRGIGAFDWMDDGRLVVSMRDLSPRERDVPVSLLFHISRGSSTLMTVDPRTEEREAIAKIRGGASDLEVSPDGRQIVFTGEPQTSELGLLAISLMIYAIAGPAALWLAVKSRREEGPSKAATVGLWTGLAVTALLVIALVAYPAGVLLMHP